MTGTTGWNKTDDTIDIKKGERETPKSSEIDSLLSMVGGESIMDSNSSIKEFSAIRKAIADKIESQRAKGTHEQFKQTIPTIVDTTSNQSPDLPGIILHCAHMNKVYLMPVLFYKKGSIDHVLETIGLPTAGQPTVANTYAENFMTPGLQEKVRTSFTVFKGKKMSAEIISASVVDIDQYINIERDEERAYSFIADAVLREWYNGLLNFVILTLVDAGHSRLPTIIRDDKLFGKDSCALSRIDIVPTPAVLDGRPVPYNLMVKMAAVPVGLINNARSNSSNIKSVATTYLNVSLDVMSDSMYRHVSLVNNGITKGPLVPVISLGKTVPGEQLQNNDSILTSILGIFNMLSANNPHFFTEPVRQCHDGVRGTLANLAEVAYRVSGRRPPNEQVLTSKSLLDPKTVMSFCENYITPRAVFAIDLPTYTEASSNSAFWWILFNENNPKQELYFKVFTLLLDKLSSNGFANHIKQLSEQQPRNQTEWFIGDKIAQQSSAIIPTGTAVRDGVVFNLEEVDQMFLRNPVFYGDNEQAISQYMTLINGCNKETRIRQYEIKKMLEGLFAGNVDITGWKSRWIFQDKFLNMIVKIMRGAGSINVTSYSGSFPWETQVSNDYLTHISSAVVNNTANVNEGLYGGAGFYNGYNRR